MNFSQNSNNSQQKYSGEEQQYIYENGQILEEQKNYEQYQKQQNYRQFESQDYSFTMNKESIEKIVDICLIQGKKFAEQLNFLLQKQGLSFVNQQQIQDKNLNQDQLQQQKENNADQVLNSLCDNFQLLEQNFQEYKEMFNEEIRRLNDGSLLQEQEQNNDLFSKLKQQEYEQQKIIENLYNEVQELKVKNEQLLQENQDNLMQIENLNIQIQNRSQEKAGKGLEKDVCNFCEKNKKQYDQKIKEMELKVKKAIEQSYLNEEEFFKSQLNQKMQKNQLGGRQVSQKNLFRNREEKKGKFEKKGVQKKADLEHLQQQKNNGEIMLLKMKKSLVQFEQQVKISVAEKNELLKLINKQKKENQLKKNKGDQGRNQKRNDIVEERQNLGELFSQCQFLQQKLEEFQQIVENQEELLMENLQEKQKDIENFEILALEKENIQEQFINLALDKKKEKILEGEQIQELKEENQRLRDQVQAVQEERIRLQHEAEINQLKMDQIQENLHNLEKKLGLNEEQYQKQLNQQQKSFESQYKQFQKNNQLVREQVEQLIQFEQQNFRLKKEIESKILEIEGLQKENFRLENQILQKNEQFKSLIVKVDNQLKQFSTKKQEIFKDQDILPKKERQWKGHNDNYKQNETFENQLQQEQQQEQNDIEYPQENEKNSKFSPEELLMQFRQQQQRK